MKHFLTISILTFIGFSASAQTQFLRIDAETFIKIKGEDTIYQDAPLNMNNEKSNYIERPDISVSYFNGNFDEFIKTNLKYPLEAKYHKVEGIIKAFVNVDRLGKLEKAFLVNSVSPSIDNEALRLISIMPNWNTPKDDEHFTKSVGFSIYIEIQFKLNP